MPSMSAQSFDPESGCIRREEWVFQAPKSKSKSCAASRIVSVGWPEAVLEVLCANIGAVSDKRTLEISAIGSARAKTDIMFSDSWGVGVLMPCGVARSWLA